MFLAGIPLGTAADTTDSQLKRIEAGNWVWSTAFPKDDAAFLRFGIALFEEWYRACPAAFATEYQKEQIFLTTWAGSAAMPVAGRSSQATVMMVSPNERDIAEGTPGDRQHAACETVCVR